YRVQNSITVTVRDINKQGNENKVGVLMDASVKAGANLIGNVVFTLSDPDAANATARKAAMDNAKSKADALVTASGVKLGPVISVSPRPPPPGPPRVPQPLPAAAPAAGAAAPPPQIQPGETTVTVTVNVTYGLE